MKVYLKENEQMTVHDLLKAVAVASATTLRGHGGVHSGDEGTFVRMMNERAAGLAWSARSLWTAAVLQIRRTM